MEIQFISGRQLKEERQIIVSRLFVDGFYQWFQFFSKDNEKIAQAFQHSFVLDKFYFAVCDDKICGMAAYTDGKESPIHFQRSNLIKHLGIYKGLIGSIALKKEIENDEYPFEPDSRCGSTEFITVDKNFRGMGIAYKLMDYMIANTDFDSYVLEVADTNSSAVKLYEKVGFKEFLTIPCKYPKQTGFHNYVYMKYQK